MAAVIRREPGTDPRARYNIYTIIHKGLRGFMTDVLMRLGRMDVTDDFERVVAIEQARALLATCRSHLRHENEFVHTALERARPGFTARIAQEHVEHEAAIAHLESKLAELFDAPVASRAAVAQSLYQALSVFIAENFAHMVVEETENHRALVEAYSEEEVMDIEREIVASLSPEDTFATFRWMLAHSNASERAFLLGGVKHGAPAEVFAALMGLAREVLTQRDYYKLERALA